VGSTLAWMNERIYRIPASVLHEGPNVIAIRVIDPRRGEGGFTGKTEDMHIDQVGTETKTSISIAGQWKYKFSAPASWEGIPLSEAENKLNQNTPTSLYNAMIHPLIPFRIAGAIWYQGESNSDAILYRTLFPAMIKGWRNQWGQGDFPFYYVQIAPYEYGDKVYSQAIREAQLMALDKVPNVGMAVLMDIGQQKDIHPVNKLDVGKRLSLWALAKTYGRKDVVYSGPLYKGMKVENGSIRISFNYTDGGLMAKGGPLTDFMIAGEDRKFIPAKAVIDGNSVVVSSPDINNPVAVRYAWSNWASPNLFNMAGLPASSFRTDDWPLH
jgi:sialate O-acetylesterase